MFRRQARTRTSNAPFSLSACVTSYIFLLTSSNGWLCVLFYKSGAQGAQACAPDWFRIYHLGIILMIEINRHTG